MKFERNPLAGLGSGEIRRNTTSSQRPGPSRVYPPVMPGELFSAPTNLQTLALIVVFAELMRVLTAGLALIMAACGSVGPVKAQQWQGVDIDPQGLVRPALLQSALASYEAHAAAGLRSNVMAIADFAQPSSTRRFYIVDLQTGVVTPLLVAHGRGSDMNEDTIPDMFSDRLGSLASSLGAYRASEPYLGEHGLSLRLDGLDTTNRSARERAIVMHSGWYVSDEMAKNGGVGRSYGCFVFDRIEIDDIVRKLENGGFIYAGR